jgi:hypothetical protein
MSICFQYVTYDRIMHGLGFISSWADYLSPITPSTLTPQIALGNPTSQDGVEFEGFVEYAYDRLMSFTNYPGVFATNLSAEMINDFGNLGSNFTNDTVLGSAFLSSSARKLGDYMEGNATERGAIQQAPVIPNPSPATLQSNSTPGPPITLETSFNPFASGSSLNHVDGDMYVSTQDFLMRFSTPTGKTLLQFIQDYGNSSDPTYGPFGPGLRYILAGIGYRIRGGVPLGGSMHNPSSQSGMNSGSPTNSSSATTSTSGGIKHEKSWQLVLSVYCIILGSWIFFI